ncbi:Plastid division protein CDP1, chloroplastic [Morella rubra]|uniref:Plastid division protein CDP1, chloroplastic n=1 Tax=Morella rubra TaxID=262757 RepID=A0A6A1VMQ9_9ROSI|nr:Plastid division protein CDP1, chloroplastic [Morella rubra]
MLLQLIGAHDRAEKDEIVKSVMDLKSAEIEEGYTTDAVASRQDLLMDVRDKLLFEPEYAGDMREKIPPKSSLRIPWPWLPAALCLLQEVGEVKLALDIGRAALQHQDSKPYVHDVLLSMALAECAIAKIGLEKNKVSQGFEALARAQCLLRSKISLGKMTLLSQIEESLEELAPACTLELLGMAHSPENAERRHGAIAALRELLRQGLEVETLRQVQDWPCFLSQALNRLMATEIVDLLPWDSLAATRKNKKSLESQNQRVVIDFGCFYVVLIAHLALGFSSKQTELINKAKNIIECLTISEGIDLKLEEAFCLFLLGQGNEAEVVDKLQQLDLNSNPTTRSSVPGKDIKHDSGAKPLWCVNFFKGEKKSLGSKKSKEAPQTMHTICHRPLASSPLSERKGFQESLPYASPSPLLGSAVKQLAQDLQTPVILGKNSSGSSGSALSGQLNRNIGVHHNKVWESWLPRELFGRITFVAVLGCTVFVTFKLSGMNASKMHRASTWISSAPDMVTNSFDQSTDSLKNYRARSAYTKGTGIAGGLRKLLAMIKIQFKNHSDAGNPYILSPAASLSSSLTAVYKRVMPIEEAEALVRQWQAIKAQALGPSHQVHSLSEVLDESMLVQWQALANVAKTKCCHWRFVLLQLSVLRADILSDGIGAEIAEIETLLEEAAELVDESQQTKPNYYSTYKVLYVLKRQDDGSWKFCEGDTRTPS